MQYKIEMKKMKVKIKIEKVSNGYIISNEEINVRRISKDEKDTVSYLSEAIENHLSKTKSNTTLELEIDIRELKTNP